MNGIKEYTDLFYAYQEKIDAYGSFLMNSQRSEAMNRFLVQGWTASDKEKYKGWNSAELFAPEYGMNLGQLSIPVQPQDVFRCDVPSLSTALYFMVNETFFKDGACPQNIPQEVFVGGFKEFADQYSAVAQKYYHSLAKKDDDGHTFFNTAFVQDAFVVYVPQGVKVDKPIQLIHILKGSVDMLVNRRLLLIAEKGSEVRLLVCDHTMDPVRFLVTHVSEIVVEEGACVDFYELEESSSFTNKVNNVYISQQGLSRVNVGSLCLTGGITRNNYKVSLQGEEAELSLNGMAIADKEQKVDNWSEIDHVAPRCQSRELFKYVLDDQARGSFLGKIIVRPGAQKTEAYQTQRNLCASDSAKVYTRPQLEIYADDVKCSHGATTGQLDENALFYLRSRGLSEKEARLLLMYAFMSDVIDAIHLEGLNERLHLLVEKRFRGELARCKGCSVCK